MPPRMKQVTVVYAEAKLQTTFNVSEDTPSKDAKECAEEQMRKHLDQLEEQGIPHIDLDLDCTDFFPGNIV
jgi:hypothetical protein